MCLLDQYIYKTKGEKFDPYGKYSYNGTVNKKILKNEISDSFFRKKFPKSLDKNYFDLEKYKNLAKDATSSGDYVAAENYLQHAEHFVRVLNERNARNNNESKTSVTSTSEAENKNTSPEKLKDSVSDEPVDIIKVLKPIPMDDNSDRTGVRKAMTGGEVF